MVGLLPLCAVTVFDGKVFAKYPEARERLDRFLRARPELRSTIHDSMQPGVGGRLMASILNEEMLRRVLTKMLDENEFLSENGTRCTWSWKFGFPLQILRFAPLDGDIGIQADARSVGSSETRPGGCISFARTRCYVGDGYVFIHKLRFVNFRRGRVRR